MASSEEPYFPPLEHCLSGESLLITWKDVFDQLIEGRVSGELSWLSDFLHDNDATNLLVNATHGFPPPTPESRASFESRTAAIHITPSPKGCYDVNEIKEDALWLSGEVKIDEVTALRIVIQEWQYQPLSRLRYGFSDAEKASIREAVGDQSLAVATQTNVRLQDLLSQDIPVDGFYSTENRRMRLLDLYMLERCCLLNVARLLRLAACQNSTSQEQPDITIEKKLHNDQNEFMLMLHSIGRHIRNLQEREFARNPSEPRNTSDQANLPKPQTPAERIMIDYIGSLITRIKNILNGSGWFKTEGGREEIEMAWSESNFKEMVAIMELVFLQACSSDSIATSAVMLNWLYFISEQNYFERTEATSPTILHAIESLRTLAPFVTLAILKVEDSVRFITENVNLPSDGGQRGGCQFFLDNQNIGQVHKVFLTAASDRFQITSVSVLAWAVICATIQEAGRRSKEAREMALEQHPFESSRSSSSSIGSNQLSIFEELMETFRHVTGNEDYVGFLLSTALEDNDVFAEVRTLARRNAGPSLDDRWKRLNLQGLMGLSLKVIGYPTALTPILFSTLDESPGNHGALTDNSISQHDPRAAFVKNYDLMVNVLDSAMQLFPYEAVTFLHLCQLLASSDRFEDGMAIVYRQLNAMPTFSYAISPAFQGYQTIREDENANYVQLVESLNMYGLGPTKAIGFGNARKDVASAKDFIPAGSEGQIISTSRPMVICFDFSYSGLAYLGKWVSLIQSGKISQDQQLDHLDTVKAEIIGLLATFVSTVERCKSAESANAIIEEASEWLEGQSDIVTVIADVMEQELLNVSYRPVAERSLDVVVSCLEFLRSIVNVLPGRIWQILARSSLFGSDSGGGVILALVRTVEVTSGDFCFLEKCIKLSTGLVEDVVARSVPKMPRNSNRFERQASSRHALTPYHTMEKVLLSMTQALLQIYDSMMTWTFHDPQQHMNIDSGLVQVFGKIVYYACGIDDKNEAPRKALAPFVSPASDLLKYLTSSNTSDGPINPIIISIGKSVDIFHPTINSTLTTAARVQTHTTLSLCLEMLQFRSADNLRTETNFEQQLFNLAPILVRICVNDGSLKGPAVRLLTYLLQGEEKQSGFQAQSLLGQLGSTSSLSLVELLAYLDSPRRNPSLTVDIWDLFTTLVRKNQQWFAILILTGSISNLRPADAVRNRTAFDISTRGKSILRKALDTIAQIWDKALDFRVATAMLNFVVTAQENWEWAAASCKSHEGYVKAIRDYPGRIELKATKSELERCYLTELAALMAQALNFYIHHVRATNDAQAAEKLERTITWYSENAPKVDGYRVTLHTNLKRNVRHIYSACDLEQFKKTLQVRHDYGDSFYYDIDVAGKMLGFRNAWSGTPGQGLKDEFRTANLNLSLVNSQFSLLHSWKALVLEHGAYFAGWHRAHRVLESAVLNCFKANSEDQLPAERMFDTLFQNRIEVAIALTQGLVSAKAKPSEFKNLLNGAWRSLHHRASTYELAIANKDLEYYRSLLNTLLLTLQFHVKSPASRTDKENQDILDILIDIATTTVAHGLRALVTAVHDQSQSSEPDGLVGPADLRLLLALLQSIFRVPTFRISGASQASQALLATPISQSALHLYSWSHFLLEPNSDPAYAPLSTSFLATLSSLPLLAEDLAATHGVLSCILSARITRLLVSRPKGAGSLEADILPQRLYDTWTRGILPLSLNLLQSVGHAVAAEIIHFLNSFPTQLERASMALNAKSHVPSFCLASIKEVQDLAIIATILDRYREAGPSAGVDPLEMMDELKSWTKNDRKGVCEDVDELLGARGQIRIRTVPTNERERALSRKIVRREKDFVVNALEEAAVTELTNCRAVLGTGKYGD